ncbi:MAG TPA: potassium/proton antiporter [Acetobacteraceae bacterium]|nr:potassium/proton antiporter [Acetobacteraceae bacterium]
MAPEAMIAAGHAALHNAHQAILLGGGLGVLSILAGIVSRRIGAPMLLAFLALGMLAGEDGLLGIHFGDYATSYLIGSVALAVILFEGGLKTPVSMLRLAFWPALVLATVGVAVTAGIVGGVVAVLDRLALLPAFLVGAVVAPTDAAAVAVLLRTSGAALPERLAALLEVESGLNDPMSVFLTLLLIHLIVAPGSLGVGGAAALLLEAMAGGAVLGLVGGRLLGWGMQRLPLEPALATVFLLSAALGLFGIAQLVGASGFLAVYLAGIVTRATSSRMREGIAPFFEGMAWVSQIVLFLMLGLLATPHLLPQYLPGAIGGAAALIFLARPAAVFGTLLPFRLPWREAAFASWVGLRGAVPIYLSIIPALGDPGRGGSLFASIFIVVILSLIVQGSTVALSARLLGFGTRPAGAASHG